MSDPYYSWWGTLPTIDAMGQPVCSTFEDRNPGVTVPAKTPVSPATTIYKTDSEDPRGFVYSLNAQVLHLSAHAIKRSG